MIFRDAAALNMTEAGYVWIVTEQALTANNIPDGIMGLRLVYAESEDKHLRVIIASPRLIESERNYLHPVSPFWPLQDSVYVLASAINQMNLMNETITESPKDCDDSGALWDSGKRIFHYLKTRNIRGETGQVAFDDNGDRIYAEYEVINARDDQKKKVVGSFYYDQVGMI